MKNSTPYFYFKPIYNRTLMYKYKSTCRFKMLIYANTDIIEIRPQQVIESPISLDHPYLHLVEDPVKPKKTYKPSKKKKETLVDGNNMQTNN